jgi:hypothetical protein
MHSAGAARIGTSCALPLVLVWVALDVVGWLGVVGGLKPSYPFVFVALFVGVALAFLHQFNYLRVGKLTERFVHEVLSYIKMGSVRAYVQAAF